MAAALDKTEAAHELLGAGVDLEARDWTGCTALLWTAELGAVGVARELLKRGASVEACMRGALCSPVLRCVLCPVLSVLRREHNIALGSSEWAPRTGGGAPRCRSLCGGMYIQEGNATGLGCVLRVLRVSCAAMDHDMAEAAVLLVAAGADVKHSSVRRQKQHV